MGSEVYDYIIVGAGSAGCVLANRLSENPRISVLLIEAGGSDCKFWIKTPLGYAKTFADPTVNWGYMTDPDPGLNQRRGYWPRGKVIGGSSSINAMAYLRGLPHDFDDWENAGARGWNWKTVRETYASMESLHEFNDQGSPQIKGNGPVYISDITSQMHPFSQNFLNAARDMGWPPVQNMDDSQNGGLMMLRSTIKDGRRWSAADAYLRPTQKRPNLRIIRHALVERVTLEGRKATGVSYRLHDTSHHATGQEIILSAGAINSPQLLQLSGIGPTAVLKAQGIDVHHVLEHVGQGLQDHLGVSHYYRATKATLNRHLSNPIGQTLAGVRYILTKTGPLSASVNQVGGFVRSDPKQPAPDIQIYANPISYSTRPDGLPQVDRKDGFLLCAQPCRPTSRGSVQIVSDDPTVPPAIQPNSLATKADQHSVLRASHILRKLALTPSLQSVTKRRLAPDITEMSDAEMLTNFRNRAATVFHPTSTCRMGHDASDSVLDIACRVHGINGLRVVDASAFPNITSGNTNAPTLMLANRAATMILKK